MAEWNSTSKIAPTSAGGVDIATIYSSNATFFRLRTGYVQNTGGGLRLPASFGNTNYWIQHDHYIKYNNNTLVHTGVFYPLFIFGYIKVGLRLVWATTSSGEDTRYYEVCTYVEGDIENAERVSYFYPQGIADDFYSDSAYLAIAYVYGDTGLSAEGLYVGRWFQRETENKPYVLVSPEHLNTNKTLDEKMAMAGFTCNEGGSNFIPLSYQGTKIEFEELETSLSTSNVGGGRGDYSLPTDDIDFGNLPNISALDTGLISIYNPTMLQIRSLARYLWSDNFLDELSKLWRDPIDMIISLGIVPFVPSRGETKTVKIGGLTTDVVMTSVSSQYMIIDCGNVKIPEFFGSALDYNPYTSINLFLPFVGIVPINVDEAMGFTLRIQYYIDVLSGAFSVKVKTQGTNINSVLYHFSGSCLTPLPITASSHAGLYQSVLNIASGAVTGALSGGAGGAVAGALAQTAKETLTSKTNVARSGSMTGNAGLLDYMKPYFIIERAIQSLPSNYKHFNGYPSNITYVLGQLSGFTKVSSLVSNTLTCPQAEQNEIISLLKAGVYL